MNAVYALSQSQGICGNHAGNEGNQAMNTKTVTIESINKKVNKSGQWVVTLSDDDVRLVPHTLITDMRTEYERDTIQATRLDDHELVRIVIGAGDDPKMGELLTEMKRQDPPQRQQVKDTAPPSAQGYDALAIYYGNKLAESADTVDDINKVIFYKEELTRLPASIPFHLDQVFTKEDRQTMPIPGSVKPDGDKSNRLFDKIDNKPGTESWFTGMGVQFPGYYENIGGPIEKLQACLETNSTAQNEFSANGKLINQAHLKYYQKRKTNLIASIRDAISFLNFRDEVEEKTDIRLLFWTIEDDNGKQQVMRTSAPIRVLHIDPDKPETDMMKRREKVMSVNGVMRVDLDDVIGAKDQFEAFKPKRGSDDEEEVPAVSAVNTGKDLERVLSMLALLAKGGPKCKEVQASFVRMLNGPPSESDPLVELYVAAKDFIASFETPKLATRIKRLADRLEQDDEQDAA